MIALYFGCKVFGLCHKISRMLIVYLFVLYRDCLSIYLIFNFVSIIIITILYFIYCKSYVCD